MLLVTHIDPCLGVDFCLTWTSVFCDFCPSDTALMHTHTNPSSLSMQAYIARAMPRLALARSVAHDKKTSCSRICFPCNSPPHSCQAHGISCRMHILEQLVRQTKSVLQNADLAPPTSAPATTKQRTHAIFCMLQPLYELLEMLARDLLTQESFITSQLHTCTQF